MELTIFLKGIIIGFAMAVPIGPIGIMCIRKTLTEGRLRGLIIGLGAATADLIYGCVATFGLSVISSTLNHERLWIRLVGGALLLFLGIRTFRSIPVKLNLPENTKGILRSFLTTVFLTLTNPLTIFAFIAIFASLGLGSGLSYFSASSLVAGVFIGSITTTRMQVFRSIPITSGSVARCILCCCTEVVTDLTVTVAVIE